MSNISRILTFDTPDEDFPLDERIVLRDSIASFENRALGSEAMEDVRFLASLPATRCWYGAGDCKLHPFVCVSATPLTSLPTAASVLRELRAVRFKSIHIPSLDTVSLPYLGYHPGTENDEIHTESDKPNIFASPGDKLAELADPSVVAAYANSLRWHSELQRFVLCGHLYYVLLHTKPHRHGEYEFSDWVILFAIGVSPKSGYLVGAVTHQVCHNYCD
ncbi:MAG: hypothetical protein JWM68_44 [Verrucomicrobiales bacterium]|nr:hypothetical protein [Verrucomicrobiales bacterium]